MKLAIVLFGSNSNRLPDATMKYYFCRIFVLLCLVIASCKKEDDPVRQPPQQPPPVTYKSYTAEEVTGFKQMTLYTTEEIVKWKSPVSLYLVDTTYPYLTKEIDSIIREINALLDTNLTIKRVPIRSGSSIQIYLTDRNTYLQQEPAITNALQNSDYVGYGYAEWGDDGYIYHGSAFVDMIRTASDTLFQRYAIHHELMHALGFIGHVQEVSLYSILFTMPPTPYPLDYTDFDKKMLKLLYNYSITAGMSESDFDKVIPNL